MAKLGRKSQRAIYSPRLIEAALRALETNGLRGLNARRLARQAGCSVGTLYNIFGNLDGLTLAANAATLAEMRELVTQTAAAARQARPTPGADEILMALARAYCEYYQAHEARWSAVFEFQRPPDDAIPEWYNRELSALMGVIEDVLTDIPDGPPPEERSRIARALWASTHGIATLAFAGRLGPVGRDDVLDDIRVVVEAVVAGLGKKSGEQTTERAEHQPTISET